MQTKKFSVIDRFINEVDQALRTVHATPPTTDRANPSEHINTSELSSQEKELSASLMRINHAGEVSAQGLYRGQAFATKNEQVKEQMQQSAMEENDHLDWCESRLNQLESHKSYLSPIWYLGSFTIGALAGFAGDKWSLGFVKETEDQVVKHIDNHLSRLPEKDIASRVILQQMKIDEAHHADVAVNAGAAELPALVGKVIMPTLSKIMTKTAAKI